MQDTLQAPADGAILFAAVVAAFVILINADVIGRTLDIMDHPDTIRKKHERVTPLVGGLAVMVPLVLWAAASLILDASNNVMLLNAVMLCGGGAGLVGYADDQSSTTPSSRLLAIFLLVATAIVVAPAIVPTQIHWGSLGVSDVSRWFAVVFLAVAMAGFVNAVNMADGQNGVVTGMFAIWAACLMLVTDGTSFRIAEVLLLLVGATFLFNMAGRVFLGDSGSYGVSFVFGLLAINAHNRWNVSAETVAVWFFIPIVDCIRLIVTRAMRGQAPSDGDNNHFHHRLQNRIGKTWGLCTYLGVVGTSSVVATKLPQFSLVCMVVLAAFYFSFAWLTETDTATQQNDAGQGAPESGPAVNATILRFDAKDGTMGRE
jgi:UDP-GlcNAc:undecaprenyl-phosphate/decaprenyl-phosphate GlcNAc-1-phosphate transferase